MIVNVEIPDQFASQFPSSPLSLSRELLEAYVLRQFGKGKICSGHVGTLLGLSFQQTEQFLHAHDAPPGLGPEEHLQGLRNLGADALAMSAAVVSDSSPINYLILIGSIDLLPRVFSQVLIPESV